MRCLPPLAHAHQAGYGYIRFTIGNDELSQRSKFVFVSWTGPGIKVMRKARLSVHIADVKKVLKVRSPPPPGRTLALG